MAHNKTHMKSHYTNVATGRYTCGSFLISSPPGVAALLEMSFQLRLSEPSSYNDIIVLSNTSLALQLCLSITPAKLA